MTFITIINLATAPTHNTANRVKTRVQERKNKCSNENKRAETKENGFKTNPRSLLDAAKSSKNFFSLCISPGSKGACHFLGIL